MECYFVHSAPDSRMDGVVFWRENCATAPVSFNHVNYSVFGVARNLFYWELIFCVFCYSYSEIGINGIVPKERALTVSHKLVATLATTKPVLSQEWAISNFPCSLARNIRFTQYEELFIAYSDDYTTNSH